jgi:NAD(P)-dependent dehydrogenase (short-subunit alcohol dehydrogenase family)
MQRLGRIDILVNNAGATWGAPAEDHPLEAWDKVMNLNVRSPFLFAQGVAKASMIPNRHGRIINVGVDRRPVRARSQMKFLAYGTSKGAVVNFTRTLAGEWGALRHHRQRAGAGLLPEQDDAGTLEAVGADKLARWRRWPHRRRRRPQGRRAAVRQRRRQAHHRADPGGRRRRLGVHG